MRTRPRTCMFMNMIGMGVLGVRIVVCLFAVVEDLILDYGYDVCLLSDLSAYLIPICRLCIIGYALWHGRDDQNELFLLRIRYFSIMYLLGLCI